MLEYGFAVVVFLFLLILLINVLRRYPRREGGVKVNQIISILIGVIVIAVLIYSLM